MIDCIINKTNILLFIPKEISSELLGGWYINNLVLLKVKTYILDRIWQTTTEDKA